MCKRLAISLILFFAMLNLQAQQEVINRLVGNLNEVTLHQKVEREDLVKEFMDISEKGRFGGADDLKLYLEVNSSDSEIKEFMDTQKADGSWPDIDYKDRNNSSWAPKLHAIRFQTMAKSYKTPGSKYYNSKDLSVALHKSMAFWYEKKLVCPNWWYNDIGIPLWMGPGFLLLKDELTPYEKQQALEIMKKRVYGATGQNKVWIAGNMVICALLSDNLTLAVSSRDSIASEIYVT
ncbi:MAG: chondroitinase, partial [Bacteroidota bacterium]|nr:chondroitinase [Bacteroidota bacterium]